MPVPTFRALSIKQPWLNLIVSGRKTIETRVWSTPHRGDLLLCASAAPRIAPFGCAVCLVELVDCRPMQPEDWVAACITPYGGTVPAPYAKKGTPPPKVVYGWHLANLRPVAQIPVLGRQQLFPVTLLDLS